MVRNSTNRDIVTYALRGVDAQTKTGNMSTNAYREGFPRLTSYYGHLPKVWRRVLDGGFALGAISQVIYSYSTPIAWHDSRYGWIIPVVSYSTTTSTRHQTHLYRLGGRHIKLPYDASNEEAQRVLDGLMVYTTDSRGNITGTKAA